jgi:hypothetical protein
VPEPDVAAAVLSAGRNVAAGSAMNNIIYLVGLVVVVLAVLALIGLFYWVTHDITQPFP